MKRHPLYPVAAVLAAMTTMAAMALPSSAGAATVKVSATSLNNTYAAMKLLKPLVSKGHGKVAALLPDNHDLDPLRGVRRAGPGPGL